MLTLGLLSVRVFDRHISGWGRAQRPQYYITYARRFRQNQAYSPVTLQTYEVWENLKHAYKPALVLPLASATQSLLLPQPNRYATVCQPGTYRGTDDFEPCIDCSPGYFQEFSGRTSCELCPRDYFANASGMPSCVVCPTNTLTLNRGSTNLTECNCKVRAWG